MAVGGIGFYSSTLFDLSGLPAEVVGDAVEVGRACIALEHRNTQVLFLLWKGLARYMAASQRRYLFGCCSLTSQDPEEGKTVMRFLELHGHLPPPRRQGLRAAGHRPRVQDHRLPGDLRRRGDAGPPVPDVLRLIDDRAGTVRLGQLPGDSP
jgi:putative hemolysin